MSAQRPFPVSVSKIPVYNTIDLKMESQGLGIGSLCFDGEKPMPVAVSVNSAGACDSKTSFRLLLGIKFQKLDAVLCHIS